MNIEEFKELDIIEHLKVQTISIDIPTAYSLLEYAKARKEENLFFSAFAGAISHDRTSKENNCYTRYFNDYHKSIQQTNRAKHGRQKEQAHRRQA